MSKRLLDAIEREARRDQGLDAELGHQRERAAVRSAAAEGAVDADLAEVHVVEVEGQRAAFRVDADQLHDVTAMPVNCGHDCIEVVIQ